MAKPFAAFDVDGTIFKSSLLEKVVIESLEAGILKADAFNAVYDNRQRWQNDNNEGLYQAYLHRLVNTFIEEISGVSIEEFSDVTENMVERHQLRKFSFPKKLIRSLRASHEIIALSGSPDILVEPFLRDLDINQIFGSRFETSEGVFTGQAQPLGDKAERLKELVGSGLISQMGSVAIGDTIGDQSMLHFSANPIMFNGSRTLTSYGREFGWARVNEVKDQTTVLLKNPESGLYVEHNLEEYIDQLRQWV